MTVTYEGSLTLGACVPGAQSAQASLSAAANTSAGDIQARIDGLLSIQASPTPSLPDLIAGAQATLTALQGMLSAPLPDVGATAAALADLQASLAELQAALTLSATLGSQLATAGIAYFVAAGRADEIGSQLAAHLSSGLPGTGGGGAQQVAGAVLLASDAGAITALQAVLRT